MDSNLKNTLARLEQLNQRTSGKGGAGAVKYFKPKQGKNNLVALPRIIDGGYSDPIYEWGVHKNLLDQPFMTVDCDAFNHRTDCVICDCVKDLKQANFKDNMFLWKPMELQVQYFSPIIDLDNITEGVQWWRYGKSVLSQFSTWLTNLEEEETPYYDINNPEKIIVAFDKNAPAMEMYKLEHKALKLPFSKQQFEDYAASVKPLGEILRQRHSQEEQSTLVTKLMSRLKEEIDNAMSQADIDASGSKPGISREKLDKLKK